MILYWICIETSPDYKDNSVISAATPTSNEPFIRLSSNLSVSPPPIDTISTAIEDHKSAEKKDSGVDLLDTLSAVRILILVFRPLSKRKKKKKLIVDFLLFGGAVASSLVWSAVAY